MCFIDFKLRRNNMLIMFFFTLQICTYITFTTVPLTTAWHGKRLLNTEMQTRISWLEATTIGSNKGCTMYFKINRQNETLHFDKHIRKKIVNKKVSNFRRIANIYQNDLTYHTINRDINGHVSLNKNDKCKAPPCHAFKMFLQK